MARTGMNMSQYLQCYTAPMLPAVLLGLCGGLLVDRYGAKSIIGIGIGISGVGVLLRCLCGSYLTFFFAMAFTGIAPALIFCSGAKIMTQWFSPRQVSLAVGCLMLGGNLANLIATSTTALFPSADAAYLFNGVLCGICLVIWLLFMKNGRPTETGTVKNVRTDSSLHILKQVLRCRTIWLISLCMLFIMGFYMTLASSAPSALQSIGYPQTRASLLATALSIGAPVGCTLGSSLILRSGHLKPCMLVLILLTAIATPLGWQAPIPALSYLTLLVGGFCYGSCQVAIMSLPACLPEIGEAYAGTAGGLLSTIQMLGAILLPAQVIAPLAGNSYPQLFLLAALSLALAGAVSACFPRLALKS